MKILTSLLLAFSLSLTACGTDQQSPVEQPQEEVITFSMEQLTARFEMLGEGSYYLDSQLDNWKSSRGLLPLSVSVDAGLIGGMIMSTEVICSGVTHTKFSQHFSIIVDGEVVSGSSEFVAVKVKALEDVYHVVKMEAVLNGVTKAYGSCD